MASFPGDARQRIPASRPANSYSVDGLARIVGPIAVLRLSTNAHLNSATT